MRKGWRGRSCGRPVVGLTVVLCLLLLLLVLLQTSSLDPVLPAATFSHCSPDSLSDQVDQDQLALYFSPRSRAFRPPIARFLLKPASDTCSPGLDLLILVPSPPHAADKRHAVRSTWGAVASKNTPQPDTSRKVALVFMLGRSPGQDDDSGILQQEAARQGDLLLGDFVDSYRNLTLKMVMGLQWAASQCAGRVNYVLKADLDTFVHVHLLMDTLQRVQDRPTQPLTNAMLGELLCSEPANRDPQSRVFVDSRQYPFPVYPPYVRGGSYVLSGPLVPLLANSSRYIPLLPVEDAFINGVLARHLHVRHIHLPRVMGGLACPITPCLFLGSGQISATNVHPDTMRAIWRQILNGGAEQCRRQASLVTRACIWLSNRFF